MSDSTGLPVKHPEKGRARTTNRPEFVPRLDLRSHAARRYRDLIRSYTEALGGDLTGAQQVAVQRAAGLMVAAEEAREKAIRGERVSIAALVKLENLASRAVRALNIKHGRPKQPALRDYLAGRVT